MNDRPNSPYDYCSKCHRETSILHRVDGTQRYLCVQCVVANEQQQQTAKEA